MGDTASSGVALPPQINNGIITTLATGGNSGVMKEDASWHATFSPCVSDFLIFYVAVVAWCLKQELPPWGRPEKREESKKEAEKRRNKIRQVRCRK